MVRISELRDHSEWLATVSDWILAEWPKPERDRSAVEHRMMGHGPHEGLPLALIALEDEAPIGVISLIHHAESEKIGRPYWVDAVYVLPAFRGRRIASELLRAAEAKARQLRLPVLFALTDIRAFYEKQGWAAVVGTTAGATRDVVVSKVFS